jgi:hypothetical protein
MKQGMPFETLVHRVEQEATLRRDLYCPTDQMSLVSDASGSCLSTPLGPLRMRPLAHQHLAMMCDIDRRYYERLRTQAPDLFDQNVNHWLKNSPPRQRIVRAVEGEAGTDVRAILSSRFALLDNDALLRMVEPVIAEQGLSIESCDVGEDTLTLKMVSKRLTGDVKVGDTVQAGLIIRNSEIGLNSVQASVFLKRLVCANGMVVNTRAGRGAVRRHVGRDWSAPGHRSKGLLQGTSSGSSTGSSPGPSFAGPYFGPVPDNVERDKWERGIWDQLQESLRNSLNAGAFSDLLERLKLTTQMQTRLGLDEVVERVGSTFHLRTHEQNTVLHHLSRDEDVSRDGLNLWGLLNAVTRTAEDVEQYDRATALEELGGELALLSPRAWERLVSPN